ncbi:MAG: hypothetical protein M1826_000983 [Phylliscum demangeonii]|nr:MAG: hypothetical protein M1826_000983 [Phylliscum demangeonii]
MKVIRKSDMLRNCQEGHLKAERDVLVASEGSRWIVPLVASFQDATNLYLVMDYMLGGDFLGLLIREHTLDEDVTKWYMAEMVLCVEEAHALNWIHRDVKPDNFLISASGHLKISDFGLAFDGHWSHDQSYIQHQRYSLLDKLGVEVRGDNADRKQTKPFAAPPKAADVGMRRHELSLTAWAEEGAGGEGILDWRNRTGIREMAKSTVGTSQYMAPEVIRGEPYDGRCDWWSIGIILYECLYGFTPFCMDSREETKRKILQHATTLVFPPDTQVSHKLRDLMRSLLQEKEFRLSSPKYIVNDFQFSRQAFHGLFPNLGLGGPGRASAFTKRFVFPDDAVDIKNHPFFRGVVWDQLHLMKPPFVPKVRSWEDTRYFEEDEPISDVDDRATSSALAETHNELGGRATTSRQAIAGLGQTGAEGAVPEWNANRVKTADELAKLAAATTAATASQHSPCRTKAPDAPTKMVPEKKDRRRPQDKMLRDKDVGRRVLELRKKGAFLGYTYRRAHGTENEELQETLAKPRFRRGTVPSMS